jgi:Cu/Ag efflux pump CusA
VATECLSQHQAVVHGSVDQPCPILMTAFTAALALLPIALAAGEPGNEIQAPMAVVILSGLLTSTLLNLVVIPPLYARLGRVRAP